MAVEESARSVMSRDELVVFWKRRDGVRLIAVAALLVALGSVSSASNAAPDNTPRIVVLGDSLTSGRGIGRTRPFPALLQAQLIDGDYDYQVINAAASGDTTPRAVPRPRAPP